MTAFADLKGFIFDLDGVITGTAKYHGQAWHQLADELGVTWTTELANGLKGVSRMDSLEMILAAGGKENDYTPEEKVAYATKKNDNYLELIKNMTPADVFPGIKEFLDDLLAHGYQISLASASKNAPVILDHIGLADYFKKIVDPATLTKGKPDPEIYTRGAEILALDPRVCAGVEDAAAGVASINGAHETSIGIGDRDELSEADVLFADTSTLTLANIEAQMDANA
ncbi:beta-phosphoglucomutase [Furfurilactobacillus sp. WILCCON 0119]|uniref:beta-phosphoglucomutase n=1 Tax=Furfurilactobacillus entadae TaxID=2922307 RepID=UPI0035E93C86